MSVDGFLREEATEEIISNVANFCSECYNVIKKSETIFYDMHNYRYLCSTCQETYPLNLDENCDPLNHGNSSLFN